MELMVVVGIIGLLFTIAVPAYLTFKKKALATEARANRHQLYKLELSYRGEYGSYSSSLSDIGFITTPDMRYTYEVYSVCPRGFFALASANRDRDADTDVWVVDNTGALRHVDVD